MKTEKLETLDQLENLALLSVTLLSYHLYNRYTSVQLKNVSEISSDAKMQCEDEAV